MVLLEMGFYCKFNMGQERDEFKKLNFDYEGWTTKDESRPRLHWLNEQAKSQNPHEIQNDMFAWISSYSFLQDEHFLELKYPTRLLQWMELEQRST